jgi:hypothetical protein
MGTYPDFIHALCDSIFAPLSAHLKAIVTLFLEQFFCGWSYQLEGLCLFGKRITFLGCR